MRTFVGLEDSAKRRTLHRDDPSAASLRRIKVAMAGLVVVIGFGTAGYLFLPVEAGRHQFGPLDALYQTVTTVATVGFREVHPLNHQGQIFTMLLIILGAGTVLYNLGLLVEAVTEGKLRQHLERRRMDKTIGDMRDHVIICGFGRVGKAAAEHLVATGNQVVVIDRDPIRLAEHDEIPHLIGEATGDDILRAAGIERARALVASLDTDAETVYLVLSARALASDLVIVAEDAQIGWPKLPVGGGFISPVWSWFVGPRRAKEFSFNVGVTFTGKDACEMGWANRAVPAAELESTVRDVAKRIARGSGTSVEEVNRVLRQFVEMRKMLKTMSGLGAGRKGRQRLMGMLRGRQ